VPSRALGSSYKRHFVALGGRIAPDYTAVTQASTDQGNISHALPSLHTNFWIQSEGGGPHTADFEKAVRSEDAYVIHPLPIVDRSLTKMVVVTIVLCGSLKR